MIPAVRLLSTFDSIPTVRASTMSNPVPESPTSSPSFETTLSITTCPLFSRNATRVLSTDAVHFAVHFEPTVGNELDVRVTP
jgi:hypothetical protein